jgi:hypothetical protein
MIALQTDHLTIILPLLKKYGGAEGRGGKRTSLNEKFVERESHKIPRIEDFDNGSQQLLH